MRGNVLERELSRPISFSAGDLVALILVFARPGEIN